MKNKISNTLSEKDLDMLLNRSFTQMDFSISANDEMLEATSRWSLGGTRLWFGVSATFLKQIAILSIVLAAAAISCFYYLEGKTEKPWPVPPEKQILYLRDSIENQNIVAQTSTNAVKTFTTKPKVVVKQTEAVPVKQFNKLVPEQSSMETFKSTQVIESFEVHDRAPDYIFPVLTEKEIKANEKEKRRIVRIVCRVGRDKRSDVARVPASGDGSIGQFFMGGGEVTNNEYRTFLFDLLINGRKQEFLKAKPHQYLWKNVEGLSVYDTLAEVYFSDKKYNYFPVVNITHEGAVMYCRWLQEQVDAAKADDENIPIIKIRLPTEREWLYAASSGSSDAVYSWPLPTIQNNANRFMANFCVQKLKEKFSQPIYYPKFNFNPANYTSAGAVLNDKTVATIDVWSYNPNTFGLFGVCGNAAEMVSDDATGEIRIKGGSWASDFEHLKLKSTDEFTEKSLPSPKIGFRICAFVK